MKIEKQLKILKISILASLIIGGALGIFYLKRESFSVLFPFSGPKVEKVKIDWEKLEELAGEIVPFQELSLPEEIGRENPFSFYGPSKEE